MEEELEGIESLQPSTCFFVSDGRFIYVDVSSISIPDLCNLDKSIDI